MEGDPCRECGQPLTIDEYGWMWCESCENVMANAAGIFPYNHPADED